MIQHLISAAKDPLHPHQQEMIETLQKMKYSYIQLGNPDAAKKIDDALKPAPIKPLTDTAKKNQKEQIQYWFGILYEQPRSCDVHVDISLHSIDFEYDSTTRELKFDSSVLSGIASRIIPHNGGKLGKKFNIHADRDGSFYVAYERIESDLEHYTRRKKAYDSIQSKVGYYNTLKDGVNDAFANHMQDVISHTFENLSPDKIPAPTFEKHNEKTHHN